MMKNRPSFPALVLASTLLAALSASAYEGPNVTPKGLSGSDWSGIRAEYQRHRQAAFPEAGGHRARNYGQQWVTRFDGRGFDVTPDVGGWRWGLELRSYGFPGQEHGVEHARANADVEKLSYQWGSLITEWFINSDRGLEHGFTLASRPGNSAAALTLHLAVRGTLTPRISPDGRRVSFLNDRGAPALNYAGLKVTDALGRELAARFTREPDGLRLEVEEHNALYPITIDPIAQQAYLKPAAVGATQVADWFGYAVAVSGDTVVVGAPQEGSSSLGINSTPNELAIKSGAAYVFTGSGGVWTQQAYLKPAAVGPGGQADDRFGWSVAVSGDTVVVGAPREDSATTGANSTPAEGSTDAGAAYVFVRQGQVWSQQAYLKPAVVGTTQSSDQFGWSVAVDGNLIVVGAIGESSSSTGIDSAPNELASSAGAAYVFGRSSAGVWSQKAYLKPAAVGTTQANDKFGTSVSVSGNTVVVGAPQEDSSSLGVNSTPNEGASASGAAYVYAADATTGAWSQQAYLKPSAVGTAQNGDNFGQSVAVSGDTVVVGAPGEDSSSTGVNGALNELAAGSGAAYVFTRNAGLWSQQAFLKPSAVGTSQLSDNFGYAVAIFEDTLVAGAPGESSSSTGINSTPNESATTAGAAYVFTRSAGVWSQQAYLKPAAVGTTQAFDNFGWSVGLGADFIVAGAYLEDSPSLGVNSTPSEGATDSGAAYVFTTPSSGTAGGSKAVMTNPVSGSTLSGPSVTFMWTPGTGASAYLLDVGTVPGGFDLFHQNVGLATLQTVTGLPTDGSTIYVRLWTTLSNGNQFNDYSYQAFTGNAKAVMIFPVPGSTLSGASVTFAWSAGTGGSSIWLSVGTAQGQGDIYDQNVALTTSRIVNGIPTDGSTVYVKLWTFIGNIWQSSDYTYKAAGTNTKAVMLLPVPGSTLTGASVTFTWSTGSGALAYWLEVASSQGVANIYGQNQGQATSRTVTGIPVDGRTIYVRLWTNFANGWAYNDYTYTSGGSSKAVLTSPAPGSAWSSSSVLFTWSGGTGAVNYWLSIGTTAGGYNLFSSYEGLLTSQPVTGLPTDGSTIYVRLWTGFATGYQYNDYTYKASGGLTAALTAPLPSSVLTGSSVTFTWSPASGATSYWLQVGTASGGFDLYNQSQGLATSRTVTGLPTGGSTIYVRLWTALHGQWQYTDYTYKAAP